MFKDKTAWLVVTVAVAYIGGIYWFFPYIREHGEQAALVEVTTKIEDSHFVKIAGTDICVGFTKLKETITTFGVACDLVPKDRFVQNDEATAN